MIKTFDLEQKILQCWSVTDDLSLFLEMKDRGCTEDDQTNFIIGLKTIYQAKFESLFAEFEKVLQNSRLNR